MGWMGGGSNWYRRGSLRGQLYLLFQTVFLAETYRFATIQNITDRQTTDRRQTDKGGTDSTIPEAPTSEMVLRRPGTR